MLEPSIRLTRISAVFPLLCASWLQASTTIQEEQNWPQWRGPHATGVSKHANPPIEWSETKNVRWKVEIPGRGTASPVIWENRIFLLTAVPVGASGDAEHRPLGGSPSVPHRYLVLALNRQTGKVAWEKEVRREAPHEAFSQGNSSYAASSAITDGEIVIASFESRGIYAFDLEGKPLWQQDLGRKSMRSQFGEGSTPVLHGNTLVVVWDQITPGTSFVVALDKRTGREIWRKPRDQIDTWATPLVVEANGRPQAIAPGRDRVYAYDLANGEVVWSTTGLTMNPIPSPVSDGEIAYLMSGFQGNSLKAIRFNDAKGDITGTSAVVWTLNRDTPYVPSPLLYDGILYFLKTNDGILTAVEAKTGKPYYSNQRLTVPLIFSSPVGANGRVYITGREGKTLVLKNGPRFEIVATNQLDDGFDASAALVGNELFLRGNKYLYCLAAP